MSKERVSAHLTEAQIEIIDSIKGATWERSDLPRIDSRAEMLRMVLDIGLETLEEGDASLEPEEADSEITPEVLEELIPDHAILEHRREQLKAEKKPLFRGAKIAERFSEKADQLYSGEHDEKATPETIEEIASSYLSELDDQHEFGDLDARSVRKQRRAIEHRVEKYRTEYEQAEYAPVETMRETPEEASIGAEVKRLREGREEFLESLREKASTERYTSPEGLMKALAYEHGVSLESVSMVIDALTPEGTEGRQALKNGSGVQVPDSIMPLEEAGDRLEEIDSERVEQVADDDLERVHRGDRSEMMQITAEELEEASSDD